MVSWWNWQAFDRCEHAWKAEATCTGSYNFRPQVALVHTMLRSPRMPSYCTSLTDGVVQLEGSSQEVILKTLKLFAFGTFMDYQRAASGNQSEPSVHGLAFRFFTVSLLVSMAKDNCDPFAQRHGQRSGQPEAPYVAVPSWPDSHPHPGLRCLQQRARA
jgi:hypothetical protein